MDFAELTRTRRTVGAYRPEPVDDALVREALALSLWAPNHRRTFPVRFAWTGPRTRAELAAFAGELKGAPARDAVLAPAHVIALVRVRQADPKVAHEDYATLACGVQIATTLLWQRGVATKWSTAAWATDPRAYQILGIDPARTQLDGALMIGYPARVPPAPPRPELDDVLTRLT